MDTDELETIGRRALLRRTGMALGAAATLPLLGPAGSALAGTATALPGTGDDDPDALFRAGRFDEAERGYRRILRQDQRDAHANAQVGYIALLSNRFRDAERYLSAAIAEDDVASMRRLAECFVRQDQHARAVPLLQATGDERDAALATQYAHLADDPWQVWGASRARLPFRCVDPVPAVDASLNGGAPLPFLLDTYATLDLSPEVAEQAGLRSVAVVHGVVSNRPVEMHLGVLDSFRMGDVEVRNVPVQWTEAPRPTLPDGSTPAGAFGTTVFYHLLATMDYAGQALVLRRRTAAELRAVRQDAARTGFDRLPLWLAGDHYPCTVGSLLDHGPRTVTVDTGGIAHGLDTTVAIAEMVGIPVDYDHPIDVNGTPVYPITPERISLGRAVGHDVPGMAAAGTAPGFPGPAQSEQFGFDLLANFTHEFFKPFAITFDYTNMHLYVAGDLD